MPFLSSSQRANPSQKNDGKPLPLPPVENMHKARKEKRRRPQQPPPPVEDDRDDASGSSSGGGGSIMRRMSSMFRPKRKPPPPPSSLNSNGAQSGSVSSRSHNAIGTMYIASDLYRSPGGSIESDYDESEDDIRRPSGLGSAVSLTLPPSPSLLKQPEVNGFDKATNTGASSDGIYTRSRAISSPNLLRSLSQKAKNKLRRRSVGGRKSIAHNTIVPELPPTPSPPLPPQAVTKPTRSFEFPVEVLDLVFSHLPRKAVVSLCPLSRAFCSAGRVNLYYKLELDTLSPLQLQKILALLASRKDLTDLVQECVCQTWPSFLSPPSPPKPRNDDDDDEDDDGPVYTYEDPREEDELKNRLLAATFTLALQRMSNLVKLTLPNFDQSLLAQHTAFGLRSLTLMSTKMSGDEMSALFTWLDGQINVSELKFPKLDDSTNEAPNQPQDATPPIHQHQPRNSVHLLQVPLNGGGSSTSRPMTTTTTTPLSPYFPDSRPISPVNPAVRQSLLGSPTLLPSLTTLHATPAILALLQPSFAPHATEFSAASSAISLPNTNTGHPSSRRLQNVYLNISTTLYTGLRPNTVMASLRGSVTKLGVRFGENVDKRTVEKVLGAVAAILGSGAPEDYSNNKNDGSGLDLEKEGGGWRGLEELEVSFRTKVALMPGMEETLYKSLQTTLPRYAHLRKLSLNFPSSSSPRKNSASFLLTPPIPPPMELEVALKGDTVFRFPAPPPSPLPSPSSVAGQGAAQQQARYLSSYPIQPIAAGASTAVYPSFDTIRGTSTTKRMSLFNINGVQDEKVPRVVEGTWNQEQEQFEQEGGLSTKDKARLEITSGNSGSRTVPFVCVFVVCLRLRSSECVSFRLCTSECGCKPTSKLSVPKTSVAISPIRLLPLLLPFYPFSITVSVDEPPSASVLTPPKPSTEQFACPTVPSGPSYSSFELETPPYKHLQSESQIFPTPSIASLIPTPTFAASPSTSASSERDSPNSESEVDTRAECCRKQQLE
ncbi:hypothetical protein EST38_g3545 [Candolleomyces aberdarensis]|uniref:F-box domain-containing protein n=1 Tax=Candolleomyces aberdarensis TaxID=2316362 RepID=A0A4Q2DPL7_9AGAR|nr:hypothetical protein EST38_g3545 [Candolleomyces aberdarensis]